MHSISEDNGKAKNIRNYKQATASNLASTPTITYATRTTFTIYGQEGMRQRHMEKKYLVKFKI